MNLPQCFDSIFDLNTIEQLYRVLAYRPVADIEDIADIEIMMLDEGIPFPTKSYKRTYTTSSLQDELTVARTTIAKLKMCLLTARQSHHDNSWTTRDVDDKISEMLDG